MIVDGTASLGIYSDTLTAQQITRAVGVAPTKSHEIGDLTPSGIAGRPLRPKYLTYQRATWILDAPADVDPTDTSGMASVRALIGLVKHRASEIRTLSETCDTVIWWYGSSDSSQGGFVMSSALLEDLAALGCYFNGTAYLAEDDEDET